MKIPTEKQLITYKGSSIRLTTDLSLNKQTSKQTNMRSKSNGMIYSKWKKKRLSITTAKLLSKPSLTNG